jgi:hypothetical protein
MSRSHRRRNASAHSTNVGNRQDPGSITCPKCGFPLAHDHPIPRLLENSPLLSKKAFERRLAEDSGFAARYLALHELAILGTPGRDLAEQAEAIVRDEPTLAALLHASNREAQRYRVKRRFAPHVQFGLLRHLEGPYRPLPETLPRKTSPLDRIFPQWDIADWTLTPGCGMTPRSWQPSAKWLTKMMVAAMLELKESSIDIFMKKGFLNRIPESEAPVKNLACFWTEEVMTWSRMKEKMRNYQEPNYSNTFLAAAGYDRE